MEVNKRLEVLEGEFKLMKGELKETLAGVRDYLQRVKLPPTEIAIPVKYLEEKGGTNWESLRLNITYRDKDGDSPWSELWWRPNWSSDQNYIGSGTIFRQE